MLANDFFNQVAKLDQINVATSKKITKFHLKHELAKTLTWTFKPFFPRLHRQWNQMGAHVGWAEMG